MSKSCININDIFDPLTFSQLDILTNWLLRVTYSIQNEFLTKFNFLKDRQTQLAHAERQIFTIYDLLKNCKLNMKTIEDELLQLECDLVIWSKMVDNILMPEVDRCCCRFRRQTEREVFLEMMQNTGYKIAQLYNFRSDVELNMKYLRIPRNPYEIIIRILDFQGQIISNTDKNMDFILDKLVKSPLCRRQ